jgi:hypothetical protein
LPVVIASTRMARIPLADFSHASECERAPAAKGRVDGLENLENLCVAIRENTL